MWIEEQTITKDDFKKNLKYYWIILWAILFVIWYFSKSGNINGITTTIWKICWDFCDSTMISWGFLVIGMFLIFSCCEALNKEHNKNNIAKKTLNNSLIIFLLFILLLLSWIFPLRELIILPIIWVILLVLPNSKPNSWEMQNSGYLTYARVLDVKSVVTHNWRRGRRETSYHVYLTDGRFLFHTSESYRPKVNKWEVVWVYMSENGTTYYIDDSNKIEYQWNLNDLQDNKQTHEFFEKVWILSHVDNESEIRLKDLDIRKPIYVNRSSVIKFVSYILFLIWWLLICAAFSKWNIDENIENFVVMFWLAVFILILWLLLRIFWWKKNERNKELEEAKYTVMWTVVSIEEWYLKTVKGVISALEAMTDKELKKAKYTVTLTESWREFTWILSLYNGLDISNFLRVWDQVEIILYHNSDKYTVNFANICVQKKMSEL